MVLESNPDIVIIGLVVLLITAFVIAFKIMKMVAETLIVSVISGVFYLSLVYLLGFKLGLERVLLFAFLGATLYMTYSFLISAFSIVEKLLEIPYRLIKLLVSVPVTLGKRTLGYLRKKKRLSELRDSGEYTDEKDIKERVLDRVGKD